ncbi:MAG: hypothetical protein KAT05_08385 [Spirochaetes bacterium]|nr:hypothetical protein [Spirochaetota bacterium]
MGDLQDKVISIISKINNSTKRKELEAYNQQLVELLSELPNFKSDSYKPISLAILLIDQKTNSLRQRRQFWINILLTILGILTALLIGIIKIAK